jgi:hypothetical protein
MTKRDEMNAKAAKVEARYGKTLGASKGTKPLPKAKVSYKGTKPHKGEFAATWKKKL